MQHHVRLKQVERHVARLTDSLARLRQELPSTQAHGQLGHTCDHSERVAAYIALAATLEHEVLEHLLACAMHVVRARGAALALLDTKTHRLVFRAALGDGADDLKGQQVPLKGSVHGLAFATGEVQSTTPVHSSRGKTTKAAFANTLVAPLAVDGERLGTLSAVNKQESDHFDGRDMDQFKRFGDLAALIVHQHAREYILREGLSAGRSATSRLPFAFSSDDRQLLELFEALAKVKHTRPEFLGAVRRFVQTLNVEE
jgi:putative methionine-R-sulfoxide reductase with GAF domain